MKKSAMLFCGLFAAAVLTVPAAAQIPGLGVRLVPKAGVYSPLGDLTPGMKIQKHLALGLGAELRLPIIPINLRANLDYSGAADIRNAGDVRTGTVSLTNIVGDLMFRPVPGIIPVQPYVFVGGGLKKYSFRNFTASTFTSANNRTDPTLHLGAGVELKLGVMGLVLEGSDYLSRFDGGAGSSKLQNDAFATVGIRVGVL